MITWWSYNYDSQGNEINSAVYESLNKKLKWKSENKYENGLLLNIFDYNKDNNLTSIQKFYYNEKGMNYLWVYNTIEKGDSQVGFIQSMEIEYEK